MAGGGWRFGGGGGGVAWWGWPCVFCVVSDVLLCILTKYFFRICLLVCLSSLLLSAAVSSGEFFPLLCSLASLAGGFFWVWFALHRRAAVFGPVFWSLFPRRGNVFLQSTRVR